MTEINICQAELVTGFVEVQLCITMEISKISLNDKKPVHLWLNSNNYSTQNNSEAIPSQKNCPFKVVFKTLFSIINCSF